MLNKHEHSGVSWHAWNSGSPQPLMPDASAELYQRNMELAALTAERDRLAARCEKLDAALQEYADPDNWFRTYLWNHESLQPGYELAVRALAEFDLKQQEPTDA